MLVDILVEMLKINSCEDSENKSEIMDYVTEYCEMCKMEIHKLSQNTYPILLATHGAPLVIFSGHLDTAPLGEHWTYSQGQVVENRVYGRGAADQKGSVAAMLYIASDLVHRNIPFGFAFTTDEEQGMRGAQLLCRNQVIRRAGSIVIGEPTGLNVGYAQKGIYSCRLRTKGKAAHAAMPYLGENAISKMIKVLKVIETFKDDNVNHPQLGTVTLNIGTIRGGERPNIVPDECIAEVDIRFPPPHTPASIAEAFKKHLFSSKRDFQIETLIELPAVEVDPKSSHIQHMKEISNGDLLGVHYASEAVRYINANKNIVMFGPGKSEMVHQINEFVKIDDVMKAAEIYKRYAIVEWQHRKK